MFPTKGVWQITSAGLTRLRGGTPITAPELRPFAEPRARPGGVSAEYVQAERWEGSVRLPTVCDFAWAMAVLGATKGVMLTTGSVSREAEGQVERSPKRIRLIKGTELCELILEFGIGVSREQVLGFPRLDRNFFEDG